MEDKKVLITNFEIKQFSGSEINVISIAENFKNKGYEVYIAALDFGSPLFETIENKDYCFINILKNEFDFESIKFDIIWAQHSFLLEWLIFEKKIKADKVILSSLSPFEPFESFPEFGNEMNMLIANSIETKKKLESEGFKDIHLFENSAYKTFFQHTKKVEKLERIAIISNHIPSEVLEVKNILEAKEYIVDIYGLAGKKVLVDDNVLNNYDLIITIGKTVQFCMALKIPVYVYDRFGGPGYITKENIEISRKYNFSGRTFEKKNSNELVEDILKKFANSLQNLEYLYKYALEYFCFENNFECILQKVLNDNKFIDFDSLRANQLNIRHNQIFSKFYIYSFNNGYESGKKEITDRFNDELNMYKSDNTILKDELKKVEKENQNFVEEIRKIDFKLQQIYNSRTWKYTRIFRKKLK